METSSNEHIIQELIAEGNDEQVVRLIDALLDLEPEQIDERARLQMRLGQRYMVLAMSLEDDTIHEALETFLANQLEQGVPSQLASDWYMEADKLFSAVLEHAQLPQVKATAALHRSFIHTLYGSYDLALADLDLALTFGSLSPEISYWRGIVFAQQGIQEAALTALHFACEHDPENEQYRRAYARVMHGYAKQEDEYLRNNGE